MSNNIDHWLNRLTRDSADGSHDDLDDETEVLRNVLHKEYSEQRKEFEQQSKQNWPELLSQLKKEGLLETPAKRNWLPEIFLKRRTIAASAAIALAVTVFLILQLSPAQKLGPHISHNYTLYPHYRGGADSRVTIQNPIPNRYAANIVSTMDKHEIPYKLSRMDDGWLIEYLLPDTLSNAASNSLSKWPLPKKRNIWHIIQVSEKQ